MTKDSSGTIWKDHFNEIVEFSEAYQEGGGGFDAFFGAKLESIARIFEASSCSLFLLSESKDRFVRAAYYGRVSAEMTINQSRSLNVGRTRNLLNGEITYHDFAHPHSDDNAEFSFQTLESGYSSGSSIGLRAIDGEVLGFMTLLFSDYRTFDEEFEILLKAVAKVISGQIKSAQHVRHVTEMALLEERTRISREIHDNLAQLACSMKIAAETLLESIDNGNTPSREELLHLTDISAKTVRSIRDEMLFLRIPFTSEEGFIEQIQECLVNYERQWGIVTHFIQRQGENYSVPSHVAAQFTRILSECLSNVVKHAQATEVTVEIATESNHVSLSVSDNGVGFDPNAITGEHLGLRIMKERIQQIHGEFRIRSTEGIGTAVTVLAPLH